MIRENPEKLFCKHCGHKLVPDATISEYNEYTGEPVKPFLDLKICPYDKCPTKRVSWALRHT